MDRIPFTEQFEVVQKDWVRESSTETEAEALYKSSVNYAYATILPMIIQEEHLRKEAFVTTKEDYAVGTIDISAGGTTVDEGDTDTAWTELLTDDALIQVTGKDTIARISYTSGAALTFQNSLAWPQAAVDEGSYRLVFDRFILPTDFARMMKDNTQLPRRVFYTQGGSPVFLIPLTPSTFDMNFFHTHATPTEYTHKKDFASGRHYLYINPPDTSSRILHYSYIPRLTYLTEYTTGTVTATAASTAVTGASTDFDGNIDTSVNQYYFRLDDDGVGSESKWHSVASVSGDTGMVLGSAYVGANEGASKSYTVAAVSKFPAEIDKSIMLLAATLADPDARAKKVWVEMFTTGVQAYSSLDAKKIAGLAFNVDLSGRK